MVFARKLPVGLADLFRIGVARHSECFVVVHTFLKTGQAVKPPVLPTLTSYLQRRQTQHLRRYLWASLLEVSPHRPTEVLHPAVRQPRFCTSLPRVYGSLASE